MSTNINLLKALSQILFSAAHKQFPVTSQGVSHAGWVPSTLGAQLLRAPGHDSSWGRHHSLASAPAPIRSIWGELCPLSALLSFLFTELTGPPMASPCLARTRRNRGHVGSPAWMGRAALSAPQAKACPDVSTSGEGTHRLFSDPGQRRLPQDAPALLLPKPHTVDSLTQPALILSCSPKFPLCCLSWVQCDLEQQKQHLSLKK